MSTRSPGSNKSPSLLEEEPKVRRRFEGVPEPVDLPDLPTVRTKKQVTGMGRNRICPQCGGPTRIVSNNLGTRAHCGPCKNDWAISLQGSPLVQRNKMPDRPIGKQTQVEPDWDFAYEDLEEADHFQRHWEKGEED